MNKKISAEIELLSGQALFLLYCILAQADLLEKILI